MELFRNLEVRKSTGLFAILAAVGIAIGFFFGVAAGLYGIALSAVLFGVFWQNLRRRYKDIADVTESLGRVLHGDYRLKVADGQEGELAILKCEIAKMTLRLQEQADQLAADKRYLGDSIADIAHQLRTPLTSVRLLVPRIQRCSAGDEGRTVLFRELDALLVRTDWLVSALLKIGRLESGTVVFQKTPVSVEVLVKKALEPLQIPIELRGQRLSLDIVPATVFMGDFPWSAEALGNILKNCMEHTPAGGEITVTAGETPICTDLIVQDSGKGFLAEDLAHIFERFYKGADSAQSSVGIGLALTKMILEGQGAEITAENRREGGARFRIRFYKGAV